MALPNNKLTIITDNPICANASVENSNASYSTIVASGGLLTLPDQSIQNNGVASGFIPSVGTINVTTNAAPTSFTITGRTIDIVVPSGGGSYNVGTNDRFGNVLPTIVVSANTTLNWKAYDYANFFLTKETNWATSGYTDTEARDAITDLVAGLITDGVWEKLYCFFPFVGGTSSSHKWNLKNPNNFEQDILYFVGSPTHNELGVVMNGSSNAAYININPRQFKTGYEFNFGCYSQGGTSTTNNVDIGYYIGLNSGLHLSIKYNTNVHRCGLFSAQSLSPYTGADTSFFIVNRLGSSFKSRRNTTNLISATTTSDGQPALPNTLPLTLGAAINSGLSGYTLHAARTYSCFWHGTGLTDTEMTDFNTRLQDFNLALNRQQV